MTGQYTTHKGSKPKGIILKAFKIEQKIKNFEKSLPSFLSDYFIFLHGSVSLTTRLAYLFDIHFFFDYLIQEKIIEATEIKSITIDDLSKVKARTVNVFIGVYCRRYGKIESDGRIRIFENNNTSLSRKKTSLTSMFRYLFRNEQLANDITLGFNPIKVPKKQPGSIKRLYENEMIQLLHVVKTGDGLTDHEKRFWNKTKLRDLAIVLLFLTYGLRLNELVNLDIGSFNFQRGEFIIHRKRDKESIMPINQTIEEAILKYIREERDSKKTENALFLSLQGTRLSDRSIRNLIKKYTSVVMKIPRNQGYSPHKLRATTASTLIERGFSIFDVQNLLDHDNVLTTQLYATHRKQVREDIIESFELSQLCDN